MPPREEYQVPTSSSGAAAGGASSSAARGSTREVGHEPRAVMSYLCGDCGGTVTLTKDALVACPHCAGRVLYKERTKR
ncbi:metallothionein-I transcription activator [Ophiocordyceps sinensis CO18]|nr:metallothionein-I transcription activator [Ophiocordyceps sinensis CO18]